MRFLFSISFIIYTIISNAQQTDKEKKPYQSDSNYIEDFSDKLVLRTFIKQKHNALNFEDSKNNRKINYKPNQSPSLGFGFNYDWLGIDLAFRLPPGENSNNSLGKTSAFDFQANIYMRKFFADVFFLRYTGFYIDNSSDYGSDDVKLHDESLKAGILGINLNYLFNHEKFSYRAAFLQNERQLKSAGSFYAGGYLNHNNISSDSILIPQRYWADFNDAALISFARFYQLGTQGGYAHTLVFKKLYFTLSLGLGLGIQHTLTRSVVTDNDQKYTSLALKAQTRVAFGYNGDRFNIGFQSAGDTYFLGEGEKAQIEYTVGNFRFFVAYRFNPPKFFRKIEKFNPFESKH